MLRFQCIRFQVHLSLVCLNIYMGRRAGEFISQESTLRDNTPIMAYCLGSTSPKEDNFYFKATPQAVSPLRLKRQLPPTISLSPSSSSSDYETPIDFSPFRFTPALNLCQVLNTIPFEWHNSTTLTFELRSKYRVNLPPNSVTSVTSDGFLDRQHPNWGLHIKTANRAVFTVKSLQLQTGTLSPDHVGGITLVFANNSDRAQTISAGMLIGKVLCAPYRH